MSLLYDAPNFKAHLTEALGDVKGFDAVARDWVPQPDSLVVRGAHKKLSVRGPADAAHPICMPFQRLLELVIPNNKEETLRERALLLVSGDEAT